MIDRVGERLGNYKLTRLLGKGGFAEVYLGEHIHLNSLVAVKILRAQMVAQEQERFLQEARLIASLDHPAIVRVLDFAIEQDTAFLIMNYAPHGTLRQQHPSGTALPIESVVAYSKQIASAVYYAHQRKVIHCDVKPENMLLDAHDNVLLSDFGIAMISSSTKSQSTKDAAGTANYMSPEQVMGKPRPASDQYALGVVVYEWLCGRPPFQGSFPELCAQHLYAPPPPLREKNPRVHQMLEQVVMTALAKEPQQRFANVQAFVNALEQASQQTLVKTTSKTPDPLPAELAGSQDSTFVRVLPQEQDSMTAAHTSFFSTRHVDHMGPWLGTAPESPVAASQGVLPSRKSIYPTVPFFRRRLFILGTLITVLLVVFGSLVFELQQTNWKIHTSITTLTKGDTPITHPSQGPIGNATATPTAHRVPTSNATVGSSPSTTATQSPTAIVSQLPTATPSPSFPIFPPPPTAAPPTATPTPILTGPHIIYEGEDPGNTLGGGTYIENCPNCSGHKVAFNIGVAPNVKPGTLQFNNVQVSKSGIYPMTVYYCDHYSTNNYAYISVNGGNALVIHYPPLGLDDCLHANSVIGNVIIDIPLRQGSNTIEFYNNQAYTSYIDRIVV